MQQVRDTYALKSFINALGRGVPSFNKLSLVHQTRMAHLVWHSDNKRRAHKKHEKHMSITYQELATGFGRGGFKLINDALNIFTVTSNWSQSEKQTKGYKLSLPVQDIKEKYLAKTRAKIERLITADGNAMQTLPNSMASKGLDGVTATAWRETKLLNAIPVDLEKMKELHTLLERMSKPGTGYLFFPNDPDAVDYRYEYLGKLIKMGHTDVAGRGYVAHRYAEGATGRLYAQGVSLQTAPRLVRKAALHGLYDYDIENCHFAIFSQLARRYGYDCESIEYYLSHKRNIRAGLAESVGITIQEAKTCLLAVMYGASLSTWEDCAIPEVIGQTKAKLLFADTRFKGIADDIKNGTEHILNGWPNRRTTLLNAMGKKIRLSEPPRIKLAHIIQGLEAVALRAAICLYPDDIVLPMHDGFVSKRKLDVSQIEQVMYEATGIRLEVSSKVMDLPADLDFN